MRDGRPGTLPVNKYSMRINEEFIEDIDAGDLCNNDVDVVQLYNDERSYMYSFRFYTKQLETANISDAEWISNVDKFFQVIYSVFDKSLFIENYRHMFDIDVYYGYSNRLKQITTNNKHNIYFTDSYNQNNTKGQIIFRIDCNFRIRTLDKLRTFVIYLWKSFNKICRNTFLPEPDSIGLYEVNGERTYGFHINKSNYDIWVSKSSNELSVKRYRDCLKAIRPDLSNKQLRTMIAEFLVDSSNSEISEIVDCFRKETGLSGSKLIDKALKNVYMDDDVLVINKEKFNMNIYDVSSLYKSNIKFRVEGIKKITYAIDDFYYRKTDINETLEQLRSIINWFSSVFFGDWTLDIYIGNSKFYGNFPSLEIDLRTISDERTIKFIKSKSIHDMYRADVRFSLNGRDKLQFDVIDDFKTHTVEIPVIDTPDWYR